MKLQMAYTITPLAANALFQAPRWANDPNGQRWWMTVSSHPLGPAAAAGNFGVDWPKEYEYIEGWVDTDQVGTLQFLFSNLPWPLTATVTATFPIGANAVGAGTTFRVKIPGGKFVRVVYTNGAVAQTRFVLLALLVNKSD